jgi:hypothetical protein
MYGGLVPGLCATGSHSNLGAVGHIVIMARLPAHSGVVEFPDRCEASLFRSLLASKAGRADPMGSLSSALGYEHQL